MGDVVTLSVGSWAVKVHCKETFQLIKSYGKEHFQLIFGSGPGVDTMSNGIKIN